MNDKSLDLLTRVTALMPEIESWVEEQQHLVLTSGFSLSPNGLHCAISLGIRKPLNVRVLHVRSMPYPSHNGVRILAEQLGVITPKTQGMTFFYGIMVRNDTWYDPVLLAHQLKHVQQYERMGGIHVFLKRFVAECFLHGCDSAPLEVEARSAGEHIILGRQ